MKKHKYIILFVLIIGIISLIIKNSYATDTTTYTRKQLQDMVVSTALSYYYNNSYTDYEGGSPDDARSEWPVNYSVSPEMISRSKSMTSQCEAFATTCYMYTFNFDFKKYKSSLVNSKYTSYINGSTKARIYAKNSDDAFYNTYKYFNKVYSVDFLNNVAKDIVNGVYPDDSSMLILTYQQGKVTSGISGISNTDKSVTELINNGTITKNAIMSKLRPGDIILNDGHAMLWVGNAIESNGYGGAIHSTGYSYKFTRDGDSASVDNEEVFNSGVEDYDVRYTTGDYIFENNIKTHGGKDNKVITILRPINSFCTNGGWERIAAGTDSDNDRCNLNTSYAEIRSDNTLSRTELNSLKVEQYVYDYTSSRDLSVDSSSVNKGDIVSYRLKIKNMSVFSGHCSKYGQVTGSSCINNGGTWNSNANVDVASNVAKNYNNLTITAKIPEGTTFVSSKVCNYNLTENQCVDGGVNDNGIITWNVSELNAGSDVGYYYNVRVVNPTNGSIVNEGMEVDYNSSKLKMGAIKTLVNFSVNKKNGSSILTKVDEYVNNNQTCNTSLPYIRAIYNQYFPDANLSDIITADNIVNGTFNINDDVDVFEKVSYTINKSSLTGLTDNERAINTMLVPYFHGGRKYENLYFGPRSNMEQYKKIYPIWSTYKNFNVGDIIVTLKETSSGSNKFSITNAWLYTGLSSGGNPTYVYCRNGKIVKHSSLDLPTLDSEKYDSTTIISEKQSIKTLFNELNRELPSSEKTEMSTILDKTSLSSSDISRLVKLKKYLIEQRKKQRYSNTYLIYLLHSSDLYVVLRPSQLYQEQDKITITVNKDDSNWDNSGVNVALYQDGVEKYGYSKGLVSGPNVTFVGVASGTYNVYASYNSGSTGKTMMRDTGKTVTVGSATSATIDYYTVTRTKDSNTTLVTKYENADGMSYTASTLYFLKNQDIYIDKASAPAGYTLSFKVAGANATSGRTYRITKVCAVEASSTPSVYTIKYYQGNLDGSEPTKLGESTCTYGQSCTLKYYRDGLGGVFPYSSTDTEHEDKYWSFSGWAIAKKGTTKVYDNHETFTYNQTSDMNLYALGVHVLYFDSGKAPTTHDHKLYQYWNPYSTGNNYRTEVTLPTPVNTGMNDTWEFIGWRVGNNTASSSVTYDVSDLGTKVRPDIENMGFYKAVYSRTLTTTYEANGGTGTTNSVTKKQYYCSGYASNGVNKGANISSNAIILANNKFKNTGYIFDKWLEGSISGEEYAADSEYTGIGKTVDDTTISKEFYAKWEESIDEIDFGEVKLDVSDSVIIVRNKMTVTGLTQIMSSNNYSIEFNGTPSGNTKVKTNDSVTVNNQPYIIVLLGDVNSDGDINVSDIVETAKIIANGNGNTIKRYAANYNEDENINIVDIVGISNRIVGNN